MKQAKHKMDRRLVSQETWELQYLIKRFSCTANDIKQAIKEVGNSRKKVYKYLRVKFVENG